MLTLSGEAKTVNKLDVFTMKKFQQAVEKAVVQYKAAQMNVQVQGYQFWHQAGIYKWE